MYVSNKFLLGVAAASGLAAAVLVMRTPVVRHISVLQVSATLERNSLIKVGENVRPVPVSLSQYAANVSGYIPEAMADLVNSKRVRTQIAARSFLTLTAILPAKGTAQPGKAGEQGYLQLSGLLLDANERAVPIQSSRLSSFEYSLEPGDIIDIVVPGGSVPGTVASERFFRDVRILAVGARTESGWVSAGPHDASYGTVTLAVSARQAEDIATIFADGTLKPMIILHPRAK